MWGPPQSRECLPPCDKLCLDLRDGLRLSAVCGRALERRRLQECQIRSRRIARGKVAISSYPKLRDAEIPIGKLPGVLAIRSRAGPRARDDASRTHLGPARARGGRVLSDRLVRDEKE